MTFPHQLNTDDDDHIACARCEVWEVITKDIYNTMLPLMRYDRRKEGNKGLVLREDVPGTRLKRGFRLESTKSFRDVGMFFRLLAFPITLLFWNCCMESIARHNNPIYDPELGIGITSLCVDTLHCLTWAHSTIGRLM